MKCKHCGIEFKSPSGNPLCDNCMELYQRELEGMKNFLGNVKGKEPEIRREYLRPFIRDYFMEYRIDTPDCVYDELSDAWNTLMKSNNMNELYKAMGEFKRYAEWYYNEHIDKIFLEKITLNTIRKVINRTWYGTRIEGLGKKGTTLENIKQGFISEGVYQYLIDKVFKSPASQDVLGLWNQEKVLYIRKQLQQQKRKIELKKEEELDLIMDEMQKKR